MSYFLMPACLDVLAGGAWLAVTELVARRGMPYRTIFTAGLIGAAISAVNLTFYETSEAADKLALIFNSADAVVAVAIVAFVVRGVPGPLGRILSSRPFVWIGQISYGIYLWHIISVAFAGDVLRNAGYEINLLPGLNLVVVGTVSTLLAATASWLLIERPIKETRRRWRTAEPARGPRTKLDCRHRSWASD